MSITNTDIQLRRSKNTLTELKDISLKFAEPVFVDNTEHDTDGNLTSPVKAYLVLGRDLREGETGYDITVGKSPVLKALSQDMADNLVFYNADDGSIINEAGEQVPVNRLTTIDKTLSDLSREDLKKYYILCQTGDDNVVYKFTLDDLGIFINGRGIMQGAAWNDYAETRKLAGTKPSPGMIVCDNGDGTVSLSSRHNQACGHVVSDTYGQLIGEESEDTVPIAVAGRALVSVYKIGELEIGDCVCAGRNGLAEKMTRREISLYPDRVVGTVCEIPLGYTKVGDVEVRGRVWINVK